MNVFDFDGTIYNGDSSKDFFFFCLKHYPKIRKKIFPVMWYGAGYGLHIVKKIDFKTKLFSFVSLIDDIDKAVFDFWAEHKKNVKNWYIEKRQPTDVIISASPEFLLTDFCKSLGAESLMASKVDKRTGKFDGANCHGEEKVRRFYELYPDAHIDEFYSDLYCDTPLARLADKAFIVKGENLLPWDEKKLK